MSAITDPWDARSPETITGPHRVTWRAELWDAYPPMWDIAYLGDLPVTAGEVTDDEGWTPSVQGSITVPTTALLDVAYGGSLPDARSGLVRVRIYAGYVHPGDRPADVDEHLYADLTVRSITEDVAEGTCTLALASDEALALDTCQWTGTTYSQATARARVAAILTDAQLAVAQVGGTATVDGVDAAAGTSWVITSGSDLIDAMSDRISPDLWLHVTREGTWRLDQRPVLSARTTLRLVTGPGGIVTALARGTDREQAGDQQSGGAWADAVILTWHGEAQTVVGRAAAVGPWTQGAPQLGPRRGRRTHVQEYQGEQSSATAATAAARLLDRIASRGRRSRFTCPPAWWVRPGQTVTIDTRDGRADRQLVTAVTVSLPDAVMTISTRDPESLTITSEGAVL